MRTRVLDVEHPPNRYGVVIYRVNNLLSRGSGDIDEFDEIAPSSMDRYITIFRSIPEASNILSELDIYLKKLCKSKTRRDGKRVRLRSSTVAEIQQQWFHATQGLRTLGMNAIVSNDGGEIRLGQVVETYMMNKIAGTMLPWFKASTSKADRAIHLQVPFLQNFCTLFSFRFVMLSF